jgi:hypothetical protein
MLSTKLGTAQARLAAPRPADRLQRRAAAAARPAAARRVACSAQEVRAATTVAAELA